MLKEQAEGSRGQEAAALINEPTLHKDISWYLSLNKTVITFGLSDRMVRSHAGSLTEFPV